MEYEYVKHPAHYGDKDDPYEHQKVMYAWKMDFHCGNAIKYIRRAGKKPGADEIQDLEKAIQYLQMKIDLVTAERVYQANLSKLHGTTKESPPFNLEENEVAPVPEDIMGGVWPDPSSDVVDHPAPWREGIIGPGVVLGET